MPKKELISSYVAQEADAAIQTADTIADLAEPGFQEVESSRTLADYLTGYGFHVEFPFEAIPTAFKASWGMEGPSIGFLAEYDALPNCGVEPGTWGHGCGHNLLGVAAAFGGIVTKHLLETQNLKGRVVVWGCPAEELLAGKVYMARDGAFRDNDAILGWHPSTDNAVTRLGGSALDSVLFEFFGQTAHGATAHLGRSALDGVILLDVAANYLREHVPENVRIHMCIRDGGEAPNVVPAYAKSWYYMRGKDREQVDEVRERLEACAQGAAMATGTDMKMTRLTGCYSRLENEVMAETVLQNFELFGPPEVTAEDRQRVKQLGLEPTFNEEFSQEKEKQSRGSTDEDNVSWLAPFGRFEVACAPDGIAFHHRDLTAQMKFPFAHRCLVRATEIFAGSALDLLADPELLQRANAEFQERRGELEYDPLIPTDQAPPGIYP